MSRRSRRATGPDLDDLDLRPYTPPRSRRRSAPGSGSALRIPIVAMLGFVVALGFAIEDRRADPPEVLVVSAADSPLVPPAGMLSTAWYCAEGTSTPDGRADETIVITNAGTAPARAVVTVMSSMEMAGPVSVTRDVAPATTLRVPLSDIAVIAEPGVLVEVLAGEVSVAHELVGADDVAVGPCATRPEPTWYFAGGSTEKDAQDWIVIFNPAAQDARVDLRLLLPSGEERPLDLQHLTVPRQGRLSVPLHAFALRESVVGVAVESEGAGVVAERSQIFDGSDGRSGLGLELGVPSPAGSWTFADAIWSVGGSETLVVANPNDVTVIVTVVVQTYDGTPVIPVEVVVGPGLALPIAISGEPGVALVAPDVHHTISVDSAGSATFVTHLSIVSQARPVPAPPTEPPATEPPSTEPPSTEPPASTGPAETATSGAATGTTVAGAPTTASGSTIPETTTTTTLPPTTTTTSTTLPATTTTVSPTVPNLAQAYEVVRPTRGPSRAWLVPGAPPAPGNRVLVAITNTENVSATVEADVLDGDLGVSAFGLEEIEVAPQTTVILVLDTGSAERGSAVVLVSTEQPVTVARLAVTETGFSLVAGLPFAAG